VVAVANSKIFRDLPPSQIVPILADAGVYISSESTFYRILREEKLLKTRGKAQARRHQKPDELAATGPNQVWRKGYYVFKVSGTRVVLLSVSYCGCL